LSIDGRNTPLWVATFHYWRAPDPGLWGETFGRLKASGYNAVALDVFWGYHSPRPGAYDFGGVRDLDRLLDAAAGAGLYVIVQPGPFIGDGANAAGLPDWLLARNGRAGSIAARYARESRRWLRQVDGIIAPHQLGAGSGTVVRADKTLLKRRKALTKKFVAGEWGLDLTGYEAAREAERRAAEAREKAWRA